jgi:hypothetical protein
MFHNRSLPCALLMLVSEAVNESCMYANVGTYVCYTENVRHLTAKVDNLIFYISVSDIKYILQAAMQIT